jgi:hypothetical protein
MNGIFFDLALVGRYGRRLSDLWRLAKNIRLVSHSAFHSQDEVSAMARHNVCIMVRRCRIDQGQGKAGE